MKKNSLLLVLILLLSVSVLWAAADPGEYFKQSDTGSQEILDHHNFQVILNTYLDDNNFSGINRFDYKRVSIDDIKVLKDYLNYLSNIKVTFLNKDEQMAYWINL